MLFLSFLSRCLCLGDQSRFMVRKFNFFLGARPLREPVSACGSRARVMCAFAVLAASCRLRGLASARFREALEASEE